MVKYEESIITTYCLTREEICKRFHIAYDEIQTIALSDANDDASVEITVAVHSKGKVNLD